MFININVNSRFSVGVLPTGSYNDIEEPFLEKTDEDLYYSDAVRNGKLFLNILSPFGLATGKVTIIILAHIRYLRKSFINSNIDFFLTFSRGFLASHLQK